MDLKSRRVLATCSLTLVAVILGIASPVLAAQEAASSPKRLLGYYPEWSKTQTPPYTAAQIPYSKLTHIAHAFVLLAPAANGALQIPSGMIEPALISKA